MPEYMITYPGGEQPSSQEQGQRRRHDDDVRFHHRAGRQHRNRAADCQKLPFLELNGSREVSELMQMPAAK